MKKLLFISNIAGVRGIDNFAIADVYAAKKCGLEFHTALNYDSVPEDVMERDMQKYNITLHHVDINRNPLSLSNFKAYKELVNLIREENIDYIHCNTPVGGLLGRLVGKKCKVKKIVYQAHGFHFYKGAPLLNWILYYPVEKWLAHYTDVLITINSEDFELAKNKMKFRKGGKVYYVPGVGIDLSQYDLPENTREIKRKELGLSDSDVALISVGELNVNKNNKVIIGALANLENRNVHYFLCGVGPCEKELKELTQKNGLIEQVHFLGYRTDIKELLRAADIFVMPSIREGLSRSIMEAMASGLPCIVSKIRGNVDLIEDSINGYCVSPINSSELKDRISDLVGHEITRNIMREENLRRIENFKFEKVEREVKNIYSENFGP